MTARLRRAATSVAAVLSTALVLSSCSATELPLPGGTDTGDSPIQVTAEFVDVLDLVPQSTVKVNDVSIGRITDVRLDGETAVVTMELPGSTELPSNALAEIRQTSLLGEKFIQLSPPPSGASSEPLADGDKIELEQTNRNPEVEEVLGALSLLLNGGGVAQLKSIAQELNLALEGRESNVKSVFRQIEDFTSQLDAGKGDIIRAIEGLNRLSLSVSDQIGTIDAALTELPSALRTIDRQRADLVKMLQAINELGDVGVRVIRASKASTIESFRQLVPVLSQFAESGDAFAKAFHVFLTYPFVDEVVGRDPQVADRLAMGDYTNLSVTLDITLGGDGSVNPPGELDCTTLREVRKELPDELPLDKLIKRLNKLEDLCNGAREAIDTCLGKDTVNGIARCLRKQLKVGITEVTEEVEGAVCDLPGVSCPGGGVGRGGGRGLPGGLGGGGRGGGPLGGITGGLGRPAFGDSDFGARGPTMGELMEIYDPDLVSLLVPGMVVR